MHLTNLQEINFITLFFYCFASFTKVYRIVWDLNGQLPDLRHVQLQRFGKKTNNMEFIQFWLHLIVEHFRFKKSHYLLDLNIFGCGHFIFLLTINGPHAFLCFPYLISIVWADSSQWPSFYIKFFSETNILSWEARLEPRGGILKAKYCFPK